MGASRDASGVSRLWGREDITSDVGISAEVTVGGYTGSAPHFVCMLIMSRTM